MPAQPAPVTDKLHADADKLIPRMHAHWSGLAEGGVPRWCRFDPLDLPGRAWSHLLVIGIDGPADALDSMHVRLAGEDIQSAFGLNPTGASVATMISPEHATLVAAQLSAVCASGKPKLIVSPLRLPGRDHLIAERLLMPFSRQGDTVDRLVTVYEPGFLYMGADQAA